MQNSFSIAWVVVFFSSYSTLHLLSLHIHNTSRNKNQMKIEFYVTILLGLLKSYIIEYKKRFDPFSLKRMSIDYI